MAAPVHDHQIQNLRKIETYEKSLDQTAATLSAISAVWSLFIDANYADAVFWSGTAVCYMRKRNSELENVLKQIELKIEEVIPIRVNDIYLGVGLGTICANRSNLSPGRILIRCAIWGRRLLNSTEGYQ